MLSLLFATCLLGASASLAARSLDRGSPGAEAAEAAEEGEGHGHEALFRWINFLILAGALGFLFRKPLASVFAGRSAAIRKSLDEGRAALEASQAQLRSVEEKLRHLEEEIAEFKLLATREMEAERERMREVTAQEAEKLLQSARLQMETASKAAQLELKLFAGQQAVELAEEMIRRRLDDATRRRLVSQFVARLEAKQKPS